METKPNWHDAAEFAIEQLERYTTMLDPECTCEPCQQCGNMPKECTGTECAQTCQCNECDHCHGTAAVAALRAAMTPNAPLNRRERSESPS